MQVFVYFLLYGVRDAFGYRHLKWSSQNSKINVTVCAPSSVHWKMQGNAITSDPECLGRDRIELEENFAFQTFRQLIAVTGCANLTETAFLCVSTEYSLNEKSCEFNIYVYGYV